MFQRNWSYEEINQAYKLWCDPKMTAKEIGECLGRNKNQVIGMARRYGFGTKRGAVFVPLLMKPKPKPPSPVITFPLRKPVAVKRVDGMLLRDTKDKLVECRWIIGEPKAGRVCGRPIGCGSYCDNHYRQTINIKARA